jgi:hypothetical protein
MERWVRSGLAALSAAAALGWAVLFVQAPGAALEVLLMASPIVMTAWLVVSLTARRSDLHPRSMPAAPTPSAPEALMDGPCAFCGTSRVSALALRLPGSSRSVEQRIALCEACAAATPLPVQPLG